jgi:hypothetical protein
MRCPAFISDKNLVFFQKRRVEDYRKKEIFIKMEGGWLDYFFRILMNCSSSIPACLSIS